ncbi:ATP-binding protein [Clostridium perfringens]|uniref:ATP-binding protein n=1 Tax=Clostridium perfringens TaxID=1502 RepID=A0A8H9QYX1_CLOPF|nr:ATP-binding protein [Clostridium perfringens]EGS9999797.1 ATP-binding protein [Clostridium perfringens]EGT5618662.1 AAA family ATPase [Clostridium perfringens]EHK2338944.1 ATP-binding protein [Clostridium perfringens]EHK2441101.1 ATP-binding protein [Clostridium perfringens]EIF5083322.1 ATP-binding protein [Clostridium perfringens]
MIQLFFNQRGAGKSKNLVKLANEEIEKSKGSIIFIDDDNKRMLQLNKKVRLIPMDNYCINSYDQFYGFLQGIISRDYDVESIYIDSIANILEDIELEDLENYLGKIELMSRELDVNVFVTIHGDVKVMPENIKKYVA